MKNPVKVLAPARVRESRKLIVQAKRMKGTRERIEIARQVRIVGRQDEALKILERIEGDESRFSADWLLEMSITLASLGRPKESMERFQTLIGQDITNDPRLSLIHLLALASDDTILNMRIARAMLSETMNNDSLEDILHKVPLKAISRVSLRHFFTATEKTSPGTRLQFLGQVIRSKFIFHALDGFSTLLLLSLRQILGHRDVRVASLGRFTRLADLVDRVDPVLRRYRDMKLGDATPYLLVMYFGGYPNETFLELYNEHCHLLSLSNRITRKIGSVLFSVLEKVGRSVVLTTDYRKIKNDFTGGPPIISLQKSDAARVDKRLEDIGIDPEKPIICFGLRDMAYYRFYGTVSNNDKSAGIREDTNHRCPSLGTYSKFAGYWGRKGYQVVRMGLRVSESMSGNRVHPLVIDYARNGRCDELDVHLFARCKFLVAADTGLFSGAAAFDRPSVVSDLFLVRNTIYSSNKITPNIFIPKLVFDEEAELFLSFRESIMFNHHFTFSSDCQKARFKLVHNSPDDILDATIELSERLNGHYKETEEDRILQGRYRDIYAPYLVGHGSTGLISNRFLHKHSDLLD